MWYKLGERVADDSSIVSYLPLCIALCGRLITLSPVLVRPRTLATTWPRVGDRGTAGRSGGFLWFPPQRVASAGPDIHTAPGAALGHSVIMTARPLTAGGGVKGPLSIKWCISPGSVKAANKDSITFITLMSGHNITNIVLNVASHPGKLSSHRLARHVISETSPRSVHQVRTGGDPTWNFQSSRRDLQMVNYAWVRTEDSVTVKE